MRKQLKVVQHKLFPSYVMIKMIMTKQTLYLIRNTRGVTGFVGPGSKVPIPLTNEEVRRMGLENVRVKTDIAVGDVVDIVSGPFEGQQGVAEEVDTVRQKVKIKVSLLTVKALSSLTLSTLKKYNLAFSVIIYCLLKLWQTGWEDVKFSMHPQNHMHFIEEV